MVIRVSMNRASLEGAAQQLETIAAELHQKEQQICERLATIGAIRATMDYASVPLDGLPKDVTVTVEPSGDGYKVIAAGSMVLFLEFGAGAKYGYGHPDPRGYGPGTYPGKGHWDDPKGWWIPKEHGGGHTYGNPPAMGMYNASRDIRESIRQVVEEVLRS